VCGWLGLRCYAGLRAAGLAGAVEVCEACASLYDTRGVLHGELYREGVLQRGSPPCTLRTALAMMRLTWRALCVQWHPSL
jgi:hypothetical protein